MLTAIGFMVLEGHLQSIAGRILARVGAFAYLFAGAVGVAGEALSLSLGYEKSYILMVVYVVIAFLAQAALGGAPFNRGCCRRGSAGRRCCGTWRGWSRFPCFRRVISTFPCSIMSRPC